MTNTGSRDEAEVTLPNFLGIGGQKCGTTWLYHYLRSHPHAFVPPMLKELAYFDTRQRYESLGRDGYIEFFGGARDRIAVGEFTPTYLWVSQEHPEWGAAGDFRHGVPERVRDLLGSDLKFIVLLRNPIHRTISAFLHHTKMKRIDLGESVRPWLARFGIVHLGFWGAHLARWQEVFDRQNFFVTTYEDLFTDPDCLVRILSFIGLRPSKRLADRKSSRYQVSYPYERDDEIFRYSDGTLIASEDDTAFIREIFRPDVARLKRNWNLPENLWAPDFA